MSSDALILRSTLKPQLQKKTLLQGTPIAALGAMIWLLAAVFLPVSQLKIYGPLIVVIGISLIAIGLLPYRKLKRLEMHPNRIIVMNHALEYHLNGKQTVMIPLHNIQDVVYLEEKNIYGIGLRLNNCHEPLMPTCPPIAKKNHCNIFFPYFSEKACRKICQALES